MMIKEAERISKDLNELLCEYRQIKLTQERLQDAWDNVEIRYSTGGFNYCRKLDDDEMAYLMQAWTDRRNKQRKKILDYEVTK